MNDSDIVKVLEPEDAAVKVSFGDCIVKPLTVRRASKLVALLKNVQGDPNRFKDMNSIEFHHGVADMLIAAGDNMPQALSLLTGDDKFSKLDDISLIDLSVIVLACAKVNQLSFIRDTFLKAMEVFNGKADQK